MTKAQKIRAFDMVGDIALVGIPKTQKSQRKSTAKRVSSQQKNVKVIYEKVGGHEGKLRVQKLKHLYGEKRTVAIHKENGILLKLDVAKTYFSPRQSTERKRVYEQIKKPEEVLVMFSGVGPFAIEIAKNTPAASVYGVEMNKIAHKYALENAKLNKVESKTTFICGNARKIVPKLKLKFDRIVMPLPMGAEAFLDVAFAVAKKETIIHFYDFEGEEDIPQKSVEKVTKAAAAAEKRIRIVGVVKCGQLAPRAYRVCVDLKVL